MGELINLEVKDAAERQVRYHTGLAENHLEQALYSVERCHSLSPEWVSEFQGDLTALRQLIHQIAERL